MSYVVVMIQTVRVRLTQLIIIFQLALKYELKPRNPRGNHSELQPSIRTQLVVWFTDYSYLGLFVPWTVRTITGDSYHAEKYNKPRT